MVSAGRRIHSADTFIGAVFHDRHRIAVPEPELAGGDHLVAGGKALGDLDPGRRVGADLDGRQPCLAVVDRVDRCTRELLDQRRSRQDQRLAWRAGGQADAAEQSRPKGPIRIVQRGEHREAARRRVDDRRDERNDTGKFPVARGIALESDRGARADLRQSPLRHMEVDGDGAMVDQIDHGIARRHILAQRHLVPTELAGERRLDRQQIQVDVLDLGDRFPPRPRRRRRSRATPAPGSLRAAASDHAAAWLCSVPACLRPGRARPLRSGRPADRAACLRSRWRRRAPEFRSHGRWCRARS